MRYPVKLRSDEIQVQILPAGEHVVYNAPEEWEENYQQSPNNFIASAARTARNFYKRYNIKYDYNSPADAVSTKVEDRVE